MLGRLNAFLLAAAILLGQVLAVGPAAPDGGAPELGRFGAGRPESSRLARAGCCGGACCCDAATCPCVDRAPTIPADDHPPIAPNQPRERTATLLMMAAISDTTPVFGDAGSHSTRPCCLHLRCALSGRERLKRISRWTT